MRLSILIPVYNVDIYLPELLQKLSLNLLPNIEIIFYNDASTDNSLSLINDFKLTYPNANIHILCGLENVGLTRARGKLIDASNAEYIWFIDADDIVESSFFDRILSILEQDKPDLVLFNYDVFFDGTGKIKHHEKLSFYPENRLVKTSAQRIYRTSVLDGKHYFWNKFFRRTLVTDSFDFSIPAYEDIANTPIILNQCQTYFYYPQTLVHYRIWPDSIVQKMSLKQVYGIRAYLKQAEYADKVVDDKKCCAYLLYKAHLYYFRLCRKLRKMNLPEMEKADILLLAKELYAQKQLSTCATVSLLVRTGMWDKAAKLILKSGLARFSCR